MPDVTLRYPEFMFRPGPFMHEVKVDRITTMELVASTVAEHLSCADYDDKPILLAPTEIDVYMVPYKTEYVHMHGAPVQLTIIGYDFPSRMDNRKDRLTAIRDILHDHLAELDVATGFVGRLDRDPIEKLVSVQFIPIPDGCFV